MDIKIKIKMQNPSQEHPASSKAPNEDFKDMDVLCTFKIKIESQNLDHGYIKDQWPYQNQYQELNPSLETTLFSKAPYQDLKDIDVLCIFKIKIESQKTDRWCIKDKRPFLNQFNDPNSSQKPPASSKAKNHD